MSNEVSVDRGLIQREGYHQVVVYHINAVIAQSQGEPAITVSALFPQRHSRVLIALYPREWERVVDTHLAVNQISLAVSDSDYVRWLPYLVLSQIVTPVALFKEDFAELSFKIITELFVTQSLRHPL